MNEIVSGDTVEQVLRYVQYDTESLQRAVRRDVERAVRAGRLAAAESRTLMSFIDEGLRGYTYLE